MTSNLLEEPSSKSSNSFGNIAKANIDRLERQLEAANKDNAGLWQKVKDLSEENATQKDELSEKGREIGVLEKDAADSKGVTLDLLFENDSLKRDNKIFKDANHGLEVKVLSLYFQIVRHSKVAKALKAQKRKTAGQEKALEIAKRMRDFSDRTTFRTWVDLQAQLKDAIDESDEICGEASDSD